MDTIKVPSKKVKAFIAEAYAIVRDFEKVLLHIDMDSDIDTVSVGESDHEYTLLFPDETVEYNPKNCCFLLNEEGNKTKVAYQVLKVVGFDNTDS